MCNGKAAAVRRRDYFFGLDLVRFVCALMVALFHIAFTTCFSPRSNGKPYWGGTYSFDDLIHFTWFGWIGVEIFFVISGLVIANSASGATPTSFVKGRVLRLYPTVWVCIALTALVRVAVERGPTLQVLFNSVVLNPFARAFVDGQYWTLTVEIAFYVAVWLLLRFSSFDRVDRLAALLTLGGAIAVALVLARSANYSWLVQGRGPLLLLYFAPYFTLGIALRQWTAGKMTPLMLGSGIVAGALCLVHMPHRTALALAGIVRPIGESFLVPMAVFTAAVSFMAFSLSRRDLFYRLPDRIKSAIRALGLATYPFYLLHFTIGVVLMRQLVDAGLEQHAALVVTLALLTAASLLVASAVDAAVRRVRLFRRARVQAHAAGALTTT